MLPSLSWPLSSLSLISLISLISFISVMVSPLSHGCDSCCPRFSSNPAISGRKDLPTTSNWKNVFSFQISARLSSVLRNIRSHLHCILKKNSNRIDSLSMQFSSRQFLSSLRLHILSIVDSQTMSPHTLAWPPPSRRTAISSYSHWVQKRCFCLEDVWMNVEWGMSSHLFF